MLSLTFTVTTTKAYTVELTTDEMIDAMKESPLYSGDESIPARETGESDEDYFGRLSDHRAFESGLLHLTSRGDLDIIEDSDEAGADEWVEVS